MVDRSVPAVSVASGALGVVASALAWYLAYRNFPPPHRDANLGVAIFVIVPIAVLGGVLLAHAVYRYVPRRGRAPWWLLVYPVAPALVIGLVGAYVAFVTEPVSYASLPELVVPAAIAGGVVAGVVWLADVVRGRIARRAG